MLPDLPLDDLLGRTFYIDGALWRVVYNREIYRVAFLRLATEIVFDRALELIASGEILWKLPEPFDPLGPDSAVDAVQQHVALLVAFQRSPTCMSSKDWTLRAGIDTRLADCRSWLARRALSSGDGEHEGEGDAGEH